MIFSDFFKFIGKMAKNRFLFGIRVSLYGLFVYLHGTPGHHVCNYITVIDKINKKTKEQEQRWKAYFLKTMTINKACRLRNTL